MSAEQIKISIHSYSHRTLQVEIMQHKLPKTELKAVGNICFDLKILHGDLLYLDFLHPRHLKCLGQNYPVGEKETWNLKLPYDAFQPLYCAMFANGLYLSRFSMAVVQLILSCQQKMLFSKSAFTAIQKRKKGTDIFTCTTTPPPTVEWLSTCLIFVWQSWKLRSLILL